MGTTAAGVVGVREERFSASDSKSFLLLVSLCDVTSDEHDSGTVHGLEANKTAKSYVSNLVGLGEGVYCCYCSPDFNYGRSPNKFCHL